MLRPNQPLLRPNQPLLLVVAAAVGLLGGSACVAAPAAPAGCGGAVTWRDAEARVGSWATVRGTVVDSHFASQGAGQPTFLDIGKAYPDPSRFSIVIWGWNRARFPEPPEQAYRGRTVCVTGLIDLAQASPGVEITSPAGLVVS